MGFNGIRRKFSNSKIHSFSSLSYNRVLHTVRSSSSSFNFFYSLVSLRLSSSCWRLLSSLPFSSNFPSITCCISQFLPKMWPIQLPFIVLLHVRYSYPPLLYLISLQISHDLSNWSPSFTSATFQVIHKLCHRKLEDISPIISGLKPCSGFVTIRTAPLQLLADVFLKAQVFWDVTLCSWAKRFRRFDEYWCLQIHGWVVQGGT
jgi:hypothetical protein